MKVNQYCTPKWLEESAKGYHSNPKLQEAMVRLTTNVCFLVKAEPDWGIERDIIFGAFMEKGKLQRISFFNEEEAHQQADFILAATPQEWKRILRKESKFAADFMMGKISLEQGSRVGVLSLVPYAGTFVDTLTQTELQFPDEMTPEELEEYRTYQREFRAELGV
jgi:hypothetical protein